MMHRHIRLIREVSNELSPKIAVPPVIREASSTPSNVIRLNQPKREVRYKRWTYVNTLEKKGMSLREISRITELSRVTVR